MLVKSAIVLFVAMVLVVAHSAGLNYPGHWASYALFTVLANALLLSGFRKGAFYFDTFIGLFLWLGFWLKLSVRLGFFGGVFFEPTGAFDHSANAYDHVLSIANWSFAALIAASFVRERFLFKSPALGDCDRSGLFLLYRRHRRLALCLFVFIVLSVGAINAGLGIYQRGMVARTVLPFGLSGVFKWLLQFGFAAISALIIRFEMELNRGLSWSAVVFPMIEGFASNVSLLSRGMVLNMSALALGSLRALAHRHFPKDLKKLVGAAFAFLLLFSVSVLAVNYLRAGVFEGQAGEASRAVALTSSMTQPLFIDRWVGVEGLMAVSSSDRLGWGVWREAWQERFTEGVPSLYDMKFIDSPYLRPDIDRTRNHFVSLPGFIAFLFYPGSLWFLVSALFASSVFASAFEKLSYCLGNANYILVALFSQVVAFRFASFGYVPTQSYLLFGSLMANLLLIFSVDRLLYCYRSRLGYRDE